MANLKDIEGIGPTYAVKLKKVGVVTVEQLLQKGATPQDRREIAKQSGVSEAKILEWVNHADLFRIRGIGSEYSDLLEEAGVDSIPELAQRVPVNLYEKMAATNRSKKLVRKLPSLKQVESWVMQAKGLPRAIRY
ncbi:DUF4332 domain-containing protein [candidate division KSB1 bacterium]|nr:DUF4332 domain-containing protein [candidate division KSB1 bacterium]